VGGVVGRSTALDTKSRSRAVPVAHEPPDESALSRRLGELEETVQRLDRAQRMAQLAGVLGSPAPSSGNSSGSGAIVDNAVFQAAVRDVVDQVDQERRGERQARNDERRRQNAEKWSANLADKLGLSNAQKQGAAQVMMDLSNELRAARDSDAGQPSRDEWRQRSAAIRQRADARLDQIFDSTQRQKYDALDDEEKLGPGTGRSRGNGN
jgi:hypothetical protein